MLAAGIMTIYVMDLSHEPAGRQERRNEAWRTAPLTQPSPTARHGNGTDRKSALDTVAVRSKANLLKEPRGSGVDGSLCGTDSAG